MTSKMCIVLRTWLFLPCSSLPRQSSQNLCIFRVAKNYRTSFGALSRWHMPPVPHPLLLRWQWIVVEQHQAVLSRDRQAQYSRRISRYWKKMTTWRRSDIAVRDRSSRYRNQPWISPPFYRVFWFFHNVSLVSTPVSFGMFATRLYEGWCLFIPVIISLHCHDVGFVGGLAKWQERRSWPTNFPCRTLDLQLMGDQLCGLTARQPGQLSLLSCRGRQMSSKLHLDVSHLNRWRRHSLVVNAYDVKTGKEFLAG